MQEGKGIHPDPDSVKREFFRKAYEEYKKTLGSFLYHLLGRQDDVQDLYQEIFQKFWIYLQKHHNLPDSDLTRKWLFKVAHNQVRDLYRENAKVRSESIDENEPYASNSMEDQVSIEDQLQSALRSISPQYRICLILQDILGYSQKDIAKILGINKKTVSTNVLRGRKQLIEMLNDVQPKKEGHDTFGNDKEMNSTEDHKLSQQRSSDENDHSQKSHDQKEEGNDLC